MSDNCDEAIAHNGRSGFFVCRCHLSRFPFFAVSFRGSNKTYRLFRVGARPFPSVADQEYAMLEFVGVFGITGLAARRVFAQAARNSRAAPPVLGAVGTASQRAG